MVKTIKATTVQCIKKEVDGFVSDTPTGSVAVMLDGMCFLQHLKLPDYTFADLADEVPRRAVTEGMAMRASRIDLVFDTYPTQNIQNNERERRVASETDVFQHLRTDQKVPKQYGKHLKNGKNKTRLIQFIFSFLSSDRILNLHGMQLFLTHDNL